MQSETGRRELAAPKAADPNEKWNFRTLLGEGTFVDVSFSLTSPRLVLPFLYMAVGAPVIFAGLILPLVQVSSLISQLVSAPLLGGKVLRKWYIVIALVVMASTIAIIGLALVPPNTAWLALLFLVSATVIGTSLGLSNIAFQDLIGRILPDNRRSTLLFTQTALAGAFTVGIALLSHRELGNASALDRHLELLWAGVFLALLAGVAAMFIRETPKRSVRPPSAAQPAGGSRIKTQFNEFRSALAVTWFRRYFVSQVLFLSVQLATPFYALHAATLHAHNHKSLGAFVIASSLGYIVGGVVWRRITSISIAAVMGAAAVVAIIGGGFAIVIDMDPGLRNEWLHGLVFFFVAMAGQGVQVSSTLYVVNFTTDEERPYYIAISNAGFAAIAAAFSFLFGFLAHFQGVVWPVWCLIGLTAVAGLYTTQLRTSGQPADETSL